MALMLDVVEAELDLYEDSVGRLGTHPVFAAPRPPDAGAPPQELAAHFDDLQAHGHLVERQKSALARHKRALSLAKARLASVRETLVHFSTVYERLFAEAERKSPEWDVRALVAMASKLKSLAGDLGQWPTLANPAP